MLYNGILKGLVVGFEMIILLHSNVLNKDQNLPEKMAVQLHVKEFHFIK